jgi:hypothetical protein
MALYSKIAIGNSKRTLNVRALFGICDKGNSFGVWIGVLTRV